MPCGKLLPGLAIVASVFAFGPAVDPSGALSVKSAFADDAADALKKCDDLASHPLDGRRYSPPVSDERFATGAAIDACEAAVNLNPDSGRAQFELGRSYWMAGGEHDKDAFNAFVKAAKIGYPIAFIFIGDAFLEGRGLPSGERQNPQTAIAWYRKALDAGLKEVAQNAIDKVQAQIDKQKYDAERATLAKQKADAQKALEAENARQDEERAKFDPTIFQNPQIMKMLYDNNLTWSANSDFNWYVLFFVQEFKDKVFFLPDGQKCAPLMHGKIISVLMSVLVKARKPHTFGVYDDGNEWIRLKSEAENDAIALFNRYRCDTEVATRIFHNINARFDQ